MEFSVKIEGLETVARAEQRVKDMVAAELGKAMYVCAKKVEEEAKKSIASGQKAGRAYRRGAIKQAIGDVIGSRVRWKDGKVVKAGNIRSREVVGYNFHRASAPGEAPATDTGRLINSIDIESKASYSNGSLSIGVIAGKGGVKYARWLEFGTIGSFTKIGFSRTQALNLGEVTRGVAPRPFLFPALEKSKSWIRERLTEAVKLGIAKAGKQ